MTTTLLPHNVKCDVCDEPTNICTDWYDEYNDVFICSSCIRDHIHRQIDIYTAQELADIFGLKRIPNIIAV